jgi:hypothetical protein
MPGRNAPLSAFSVFPPPEALPLLLKSFLQAILRPWMTRIKTVMIAKTNKMWMNPPRV